MKKRLRTVIAIVALFIVIATVSVHYYTFVSQTICVESISHLTERILHGKDMVVNSVVPGKPKIMVMSDRTKGKKINLDELNRESTTLLLP